MFRWGFDAQAQADRHQICFAWVLQGFLARRSHNNITNTQALHAIRKTGEARRPPQNSARTPSVQMLRREVCAHSRGRSTLHYQRSTKYVQQHSHGAGSGEIKQTTRLQVLRSDGSITILPPKAV